MEVKIYFSDFFDVSPDDLENYGAFNVSLVNDIPVFVDPFLLFNSTKPEYVELHNQIIQYVTFLRDMSIDGGINRGLLRSWFMFSEVRQNWLGYSKTGNRGRGLGKDFANTLNANLHSIFTTFGHEEIAHGSHLEKLCLIKGGVGRDNISDFTVNLIKSFLASYTKKFALTYIDPKYLKRFSVARASFNYETRSWMSETFTLPSHNGDYVLLTPKDILTREETWINRQDLTDEFDQVLLSIPNEALRAQINGYFLRAIPPAKGKKKKPSNTDIAEALTKVIGQYPELLDYFIRYKEDNGDQASAISSERISEATAFFVNQVREFVSNTLIPQGFYAIGSNSHDEAMRRVQFLKHVIEDNDGYRR